MTTANTTTDQGLPGTSRSRDAVLVLQGETPGQVCHCADDWVSIDSAAVYFDLHRDSITKARNAMVATGMGGVRKTDREYRVHLAAMDKYFQDEAKRHICGSPLGATSGSDTGGYTGDDFDIPRTWR